MRHRRKENRIHLRFKDAEILDHYEICAAKQGLSLNNWVRLQLGGASYRDRHQRLYIEAIARSVFTSQKILEQLAEPQIKDVNVEQAKSEANDYMRQISQYLEEQNNGLD